MIDPRFEPLSNYPIQRVERFARDIAWGAYFGKWNSQLSIQHDWDDKTFKNVNEEFSDYISRVWDNVHPDINLLAKFGYIQEVASRGGMEYIYDLTDTAYLLLRKTVPTPAFISYRRKESSALALLIVARMKEHGLSPFLDMHPDLDGDGGQLPIGKDWELELKAAIEARQYFIVLIGPQSLAAGSYVRTEIAWALEADKTIIPFWHNNFNPDKHLPTDLDTRLRDVVKKTNGIRVEAENPTQYNAAIILLLAQFGIVP